MSERFQPVPEAAVQAAPDIVLAPQDDRVQAAVKLLEAGVDRLMDTAQFKDFLFASSQMYQYSFNNTLLIMQQRPDATTVNSFTRWKNLERSVKKGERALKVFVPHLVKRPDPVTGEMVEQLTGFGLGNVFDIKQTEGKPLAEPPRAQELRESSEQARLLWGYTSDWLASHGVAAMKAPSLEREAIKGAWIPEKKLIIVKPGMSDDQSAKTLIHEAAHFVADHKHMDPKADAEGVAEGSAFVVMSRYGIDTGEYTFPYVASWSKDRDRFKSNLGMIQRTAKTIIEGVEGRQRQP